MKKVIILLIVIFNLKIVLAQDVETCQQIVDLTIESIEQQSTDKLETRLATDFSIAGQEGEIAKMVLKQLISQLNDKVLSYEIISQTQNNDELTLVYNTQYEKMGEKEATFVFNADNQLKELALFAMEVKQVDKAETQKSTESIIEVPFQMAGNLIQVEVMLNGEKRPFILDSGSPRLILNARYLTEETKGNTMAVGTKGVGGSISGMGAYTVENLDFAGIQIENQEVLTLDIAHLEKELEAEAYGLIGYDFLKEYDLLFDYEKQVITLIQPEEFENYASTNFSGEEIESIPFELKHHIPIIQAEIDGKVYSFGLDCGAEGNLMDDDLFAEMESQLVEITEDDLVGADNNPIKVKKGKVQSTQIGENTFEKMSIAFNDISHLNEGYQLNLDGLMGYELLSKQKTVISYARKELLFIR